MHKVSIITTCLGIPRFKSGENRSSISFEAIARIRQRSRTDAEEIKPPSPQMASFQRHRPSPYEIA